MDLKQFDGLASAFDEGVEIDILFPVNHAKAGQKTGLRVTVASYQSERVKKVQRRLANAAMRENKRNPKKVSTAEEVEEKAHEIVAAAVLAWDGFELGKEPLACTPENVLMVLDNPDLWFIGEQIDKAADDQTAFTKA